MTAPGPLVLVVEDEPQMRRFLRASLESRGFRLLEASTAAEATLLATSHNPEVILLDLGLPDGDGLELTQQLRGWTRVPIIVVSARGREDDKVDALDAGADDYLTKPFGVKELLARIRAALRRAQAPSAGQPSPVIELGGLRIDLARRMVSVDGAEKHLTPTEYRLLSLFAQNMGKVITHRQILREVWGPGHEDQTHYVRVQMVELRKKLERNPAQPRWLITEQGVGYQLRDHE